VPALHKHFERVGPREKLVITLDASTYAPHSPDYEEALYRVVQEALNNVAKHANATQVSVLLEISSEDVAVIIEDNGRGFNPDRASDAPSRHSGMGLLGMRERAAQFEGSVQIESSPGQGTTVFVRVPAMTGGGPST
jgi:signal transduction histidine kinase